MWEQSDLFSLLLLTKCYQILIQYIYMCRYVNERNNCLFQEPVGKNRQCEWTLRLYGRIRPVEKATSMGKLLVKKLLKIRY